MTCRVGYKTIKHFNACDRKTKINVAEIYSRATSACAAKFLDKVIDEYPIKIESVQVAGLRSAYEFGIFKPEIYAGITYDIVSDKDTAVVSLPNGSSYTVDGKNLNRFGTELNGSITARLTDNASITVGYEGKFRKHYQDHTGLINAKYEF